MVLLESRRQHLTLKALARELEHVKHQLEEQTSDLKRAQHITSPSIGIVLIERESLSTGELLKRVDMAMYKAKAEGRNAIRFFNPRREETVNMRAELEADLRQALAEQAFYLDYQPQVNAAGRIDGVEALLRWRHWRRGLVPTAHFLPLAEELGLIMEIDGWILQEGCWQLARWSDNAMTRGLVLSLNISGRQFHHPDFAAQMLGALARAGTDPAKLKIEITERTLVNDFDDTKRKMMTLKDAGVRFALDGLGIGYSPLTCL